MSRIAVEAQRVALALAAVDTDAAADAIADRLAQADDAVAILAKLTDGADFNRLEWIIQVAAVAIGPKASPVLVSLTRHRDSDIRADALSVLVEIAPDVARPLAPKIRRRLQSSDYYEPVVVMWALAALGDKAALPQIEAVAMSWRHVEWRVRVAEIVEALLEGNHESVLQRIKDHDHLSMPWLARAASMVGTDEARATLTHCEREFADDECGPICGTWLRATEVRRRTKPPSLG